MTEHKGQRLHLGVNIDHVATLRQARGTAYPDPARAAVLAEKFGADSITMHLREDRRHIQDRDLYAVREVIETHINLELAVTEQMLDIACDLQPSDCCLVPERREELTTEGGLDVEGQLSRIAEACARLAAAGIRVSLFIDPDPGQLDAATKTGAAVVEIHTGAFAEAADRERQTELRRVTEAARHAADLGLTVHAGHGLNYGNVEAIAAIPEIVELNIGHAIVARAVFDGIGPAVAEMKRLMRQARAQ